jgi:antitoxin (DNA-binding transcriptional repressor) of toxin-antitoxin stability system
MAELFTVMIVWDDELLSDVAQRVSAEGLRLVIVREGEPLALLVPFSDRDALEIGLWEKGAKEHIARIFGEPLTEPQAFTTQGLDRKSGEMAPTPDNFDLFDTRALMNFEACPRCGEWVALDKKGSHQCGE